MDIVGKTLETARQHFLDTHGYFYKTASSNPSTLENWLNASEDPIAHSIDYSASLNGVDDPQILETIYASMKFRVLAGILTRPVEYEIKNILSGGLCAHQEYDPETGGWPCKVPNNQTQADNFHEKFGHGCACPFYEKPGNLTGLEKSKTELEKMVYDEEKSLDEAWAMLGVRNAR